MVKVKFLNKERVREADWIDANQLCKIFFKKRNLNNTHIIHRTEKTCVLCLTPKATSERGTFITN